MTTGVTGIDYGSLGLAQTPAKRNDELGQEAFLELMVKQLENQDPFKPLESGEFLGQLAQFGTVQGLSTLQTSFDQLASSLVSSQALQAASLVGRSALVATSTAALPADGTVTGAVELPSSASLVRVQIRGAGGEVIREIELGDQPAGVARFTWDGKTSSGATAPPGRYEVVAQYSTGDGAAAADVLIAAPVESVVFGDDGFRVQLRGLGELPFSAVREIRAD